MIQRLARQLGKEERDLQVLEAVIDHQPIGITRIAVEADIDEHKARYSLRMLEEDGLVEPTPQGAVTAENIDAEIADINEGLDHLVERMEGLKDIDI
jgi:predicted transcriptional regulator